MAFALSRKLGLCAVDEFVVTRATTSAQRLRVTCSSEPTSRSAMWRAFLLLGTASAEKWNFTVYSEPIKLRFGDVYNYQQGPMKLPGHIVSRYAGEKMMAITGFDVEMVRQADGSEELVKLSDHYLHHYILAMGHVETMTLGGYATGFWYFVTTL